MIKDSKLLASFEKRFISESRLSYEKALDLIEAMLEEALSLGIMPPDNPLEGIETDIRVARIINSCSKSSSQK